MRTQYYETLLELSLSFLKIHFDTYNPLLHVEPSYIRLSLERVPPVLGHDARSVVKQTEACHLILSFLLAFCVSLVASATILSNRHQLFRLVRRSDLRAPQASHTTPTLRLGGVGIFLGLAGAAAIDPSGNQILLPLLVAALPIYVSGLLEDFGRSQSPTMRLAMATVSGVLAVFLLNVVLPHIGIPALDPILSLFPVAVAFTLFATAGIVHAFNLVDGLNGFAGFNALIALGALLALAGPADTPELLLPAVALGGALLGFLLFNFPSGKLFLGDAGAYLVGFCLAWMAVHVVASSRETTPWAVLLVFFWPVADTFFAIARRRRKGTTAAQADRLHAHHVMMRGIEITLFGEKDRKRSNPLASAL
jgi:UDP-GlcNAc:undecaprenyl-phosphate/decaprenyl-phosphate GlcNAc-1-phosphate transferase